MHSIVIPHFNQPDTLERTVTQLLSQTQVPEEIIIVDDGSTVPLPTFAAPVQMLHRPRHPRGFANHATCVNAGMARTRGEQITLMCANWTFPSTFCERVRVRVQAGTIWCGANAKQGYRQATDPQDADNGLHYHLHRDDWIDWEERFDTFGGNHHVLWWLHTQMQAGVQFWYDPELNARHRHPPFQDGAKIAMNPRVSWACYQALVRGEPKTLFNKVQVGEEPEAWYSRTEATCHCTTCTDQ